MSKRTLRDKALAFRVGLGLVAMIAAVPSAHAQLPGVQVPNVPRVDLPGTVNDTLGGLGNTARGVGDTVGTAATRARRLADVRRLRIDELLRSQRERLERDPAGQPILRAEIVAFEPSEAALERARAEGFEIARERVLEALESRVVVLRAPGGMTTRRALRRLRDLDPEGSYDYNHVYLDSGTLVAAGAVAPASAEGQAARNQAVHASVRVAFDSAAGGVSAAATSPSDVRVGLVDTGIHAAHPVFGGSVVHQHGCDGNPVPAAHGTAVASLLVGKSQPFNGAAPGAQLFVADVYCGLGIGGTADAIVEGMAWIAGQRVPVINVSLVGPRNLLLENVVRLVIARGHIVVAAVGNDGPSAPPLYPASYPGVVGVTAVDARKKVLLEACRGKHVDFAAPGADMAAADLSSAFSAVRGTSFAAPIVSGLLAVAMNAPDRGRASETLESLRANAVDLGARGIDKVYGAGLVGDGVRAQAAMALVGAAGDSGALAKPVRH